MTKEEIIKQIEDQRTTDNKNANTLIRKYLEVDKRILKLVQETNIYFDKVCLHDDCSSYDAFLDLFKKIKKIDRTVKVTGYAVYYGAIQIDCDSHKVKYYFIVSGDQESIIKRVSNGKCHIEDDIPEQKVVCDLAGQ